MERVIDKIEAALRDIVLEGIRPSLLIINQEDETGLFTQGTIPKPESVEKFVMDKYQVELMVITKDKKSEPQFYGSIRQDSFTS